MFKAFILIGAIFSLKTFVDSGEFRKIEPHFNGNCEPIFGLDGPEDIIIINDSTAIISADPRRKSSIKTKSLYSYEKKDSTSNQGSIFLYDLINNDLLNLTQDNLLQILL